MSGSPQLDVANPDMSVLIQQYNTNPNPFRLDKSPTNTQQHLAFVFNGKVYNLHSFPHQMTLQLSQVFWAPALIGSDGNIKPGWTR